VIGNGSHTNAQTSMVAKTYNNSKLTSAIVIVFSCFDWNHCIWM